jgi:PAS domain S-box-containing protein
MPLVTALRVLTDISESKRPQLADLEVLRQHALPTELGFDPDELATLVLQRELAKRKQENRSRTETQENEGALTDHTETEEGRRAEEALRNSETRLVADLDAMTRLHDVGALSVREGNLETVLDKIVDAAIAIARADFGNIQLLDADSKGLKIAAQRGLPQWWVDYWNVVYSGEGACGTALEREEPIIVEDVERSPIFADAADLEVQLRAGVRACLSTPLIGRSGRPIGMLNTHYKMPHTPDDRSLRLQDLLARQATDIIERAQAEAAIAGAVQRLNVHMDNSPLAVIEFDCQGRVVRWSMGAERMFGWSAEEIVGRAIEEVPWVYADDADVVRQVSEDMLNGKRPRNVSRNRNYRKDGSLIQCEWYNSAIYDSEGKLSSMLSQVLDVTERRQSEERLRQAQKMESLGLLAGGVAHDFNNLLVGVIGNASLAQEMFPRDHPAAELLESVIKTGEQAAHLTRQMLAYSGKGHFLIEPLDLSPLVDQIIGLIRPSLSKKVALHLDLEAGLPSIEADRGQVQQILMNLVINAAEAIGSHDGVVTIRTGVQLVDEGYQRLHPETLHLTPGAHVVLEVRDTGCGMDDAVKAKIFDPFFSTKFTGRGLGLAAVAGIVRGHKSAIAVTSEPGEGSRFTVLFPASIRPPAGQVAQPAATAQGSGVILVIDDEEVVREMVRRALARYGYTALTVESGDSAIDLFQQHPGKIDLVILDLSMPGMSGEETLLKLRKIRPELKVLASSGYSETEALAMFRGQDVSGFIQKPYTSAGIAERVKSALG